MNLVRWEDEAVQEISAAWTTANANLRRAISTAVHQVTEILQQDEGAGESRTEGRRILFVNPLGLTFRPEPYEERVSVLHAWVIHKRQC